MQQIGGKYASKYAANTRQNTWQIRGKYAINSQKYAVKVRSKCAVNLAAKCAKIFAAMSRQSRGKIFCCSWQTRGKSRGKVAAKSR
jgi:hypothetical protein